MKKTKAVLAIILAAALCGCSSKEEGSSSSSVVESTSTSSSTTQSSSTSSSSSSTTSSTESSTESKSEPVESSSNETFLKGLAGDTIMKSDIKQVFVPEGEDASVEKLTEENFQSVLCMGFIYAAEPKGVFRTNLDNADVYDETEMSFSDISDEKDTNFIRLNVGEKMCGMTLTFAETNFARNQEQEIQGVSDSFFCYGACKFSGETTLTGYISIFKESDCYNVFEGDVRFVPTEGNIPVINYNRGSQQRICHSMITAADGDFVWSNEYGIIRLGNVNDDSSLSVFHIPDDGNYYKCKIVIDNLEYTSGVDLFSNVSANLVSIELL